MKSCFVLDGRHIQDHFPGIGRYVFNLARALARVAPQYRFRIICNPNALNTRFDINSLAEQPNVEIVRVDIPTFSPREQLIRTWPKLLEGAALWHSAYYVMPYLLPAPVVVTLEDVTPLVLPDEMPNPIKRLAYSALNRMAASRAARLITLSNAARDDIMRLLSVPREKLSVVPLAPDARFKPIDGQAAHSVRERLALPERYVAYVGSNKPHKNLVRLVRAWATLDSDATLVIAGHWDARYPEAERLAENIGRGRIIFRRDVAESDLPALLSTAEAFVFPSLHEGFGLPPLEAMACGTPVACADTSSLPEVVGEAALRFNPLDISAMASALTRLLADSALRDTLRAKGLVQAAKFSWERTARETLAVYESVASLNGAG